MLNIAGIVEESSTDGKGLRFVIFTQGCAHKCVGCQNPETHEFNIGRNLNNNAVLEYLKSNPLLDGVTFSGGDPMYQAKDCAELAKLIKSETSLSIWCYTGFTFEDLLNDEYTLEFLNYIDILVDGEYVEKLKSLNLRFRGSSNQRFIDVQRSLKTRNTVEIKFD